MSQITALAGECKLDSEDFWEERALVWLLSLVMVKGGRRVAKIAIFDFLAGTKIFEWSRTRTIFAIPEMNDTRYAAIQDRKVNCGIFAQNQVPQNRPELHIRQERCHYIHENHEKNL